jgi:hypothetical protein
MMSEMTPIHLEYTFTHKEWMEVRAAATARSRRRNKIIYGITSVIFLTVLVRTLVSERHVAGGPSRQPITTPKLVTALANQPSIHSIAILLIPWVIILALALFFIWRIFRTQRVNNPMGETVYVLDLDGNGVQVSTSTETTRWCWEAFNGSSETPSLLLLRLQSEALLPIPKRAAGAGQLEQLRRVVKERAVPRSGGFPVQQSGPTGTP